MSLYQIGVKDRREPWEVCTHTIQAEGYTIHECGAVSFWTYGSKNDSEILIIHHTFGPDTWLHIEKEA